jgi:hypothetical protein
MQRSLSIALSIGPDGEHQLICHGMVGDAGLAGEDRDVHVQAILTGITDGIYEYAWTMNNQGAVEQRVGLSIVWEFWAEKPPRWMVPGMFYGDNRGPESVRQYPRFVARKSPKDDALTSSYWGFRSDRLPTSAVFAWPVDADAHFGLAMPAEIQHIMSGVAFGFDPDHARAWIGLNFPYVEEPVAYTADVRPYQREACLMTLAPGASVSGVFSVVQGDGGPHAYAKMIRHVYAKSREHHDLAPWMGVAEAAELAAYGLFRWHYQPSKRPLYETIAFDREGYDGDRRHMHVGWVSGAPHAYALLSHGWRVENAAYRQAACAVMDHIVEGMAPAGILWGEWTEEQGFGPGWTNAPNAIHSRTIGEAVWFLLRALELEREHGVEFSHHQPWRSAIDQHLRYISRIQSADGNLGTYYDALDERGRVLRWDGSGGLIWIPFLLSAARVFSEERWTESALRAGQFYAAGVRDGVLFGAPEDVDRSPSSEDGYNAIVAYMALYQATGETEWLDLAKTSAEWTMTFRFSHNISFARQTLLGAYDFRSRGADLASPANNHLHSYGLLALPEMLALAKITGDSYYRQRTRDNLACFLQFIAREDGDFNALRGMISERYYQTDWAQSKGKLLGLSHAWCIGLLLYAAEHLMAVGDDLLNG